MSQTIKTFNYEGQDVEFDLSTPNIMVNATEMAKKFDKRIDVFLKADHVKAFIKAAEFPPNGGNSSPISSTEMIQTRGHMGTYFHRLLALKFAAWLDPFFELWVYATIDDLLFGKYKLLDESLKKTAERKKQIEDLQEKLEASDEYKEMKMLELEERQAAYARSQYNKQQISLFQLES